MKSFIKNKTSNNSSFDLSNDFDYLDGSLDVMIGIAKYMGFSKAILLGCDYLGQPKVDGHFYSDEKPDHKDLRRGAFLHLRLVFGCLDRVSPEEPH